MERFNKKSTLKDLGLKNRITLSQDWLEANNELVKDNEDVELYKSNLYSVINEDLRSDSISEINLRITEGIMDTLNKAGGYPTSICLYRGVGNRFSETLVELEVGDKIILKGFSSQTIDLNTAKDFIGGPEDGALMIFCYPANSKFLYIEIGGEYEMLTYPNMEIFLFKVDQIDGYTAYFFKVLVNLDTKLEYKLRKTYDYEREYELTKIDLPQRYKDLVDPLFIRSLIENGNAYPWFDKDQLTEKMAFYMMREGRSLENLPSHVKTYEVYREAVKYDDRNLDLVPEPFKSEIREELNL